MKFASITPAALAVCLVFSPVLVADRQAETPAQTGLTVVKLPPNARSLNADLSQLRHPRISLLQRIHDAYQDRQDWRALAEQHLVRVDSDHLLLEVRLQPDQQRVTSETLARQTGLRVHAQNVPGLFDAWVPVSAIARLLETDEIIILRPAREVRTTGRPGQRTGSVTTEGVAASGLEPYHDLGATGEDVIIAMVDAGFNNWQSLQSSGDWPPNARLRRFVVEGSTVHECPGPSACSRFESGTHGASTTEIAYDTAPGATFWVYDTRLISEWYLALDHASNVANHGGQRADIISASLGAPLDGIGDGSNCPPMWGSPCGTIAEAAELARSRGSLVTNASGNEREDHWGGLYNGNDDSPGGGYVDTHIWVPGGGNLNQSPFCLSAGFPIQITMHWDDWSNWADHDYDLFLYRNEPNGSWDVYASSTLFQEGNPGEHPIEIISTTASGTSQVCGGSGSNYALLVARWDAPTDRNLQVFSNIGFFDFVPERSLGFPADSPHVFSVSAINAFDNFDEQAYFSSEGPVLAPGGGLPPPVDVDKPDGVSFTWVSTVTDGAGGAELAGFSGTSAATPHVAGVAAVLSQLRKEKPVQTADNPAVALHQGLALVGLDGDNDLGDALHNPVFGYGRIRLRECEQQLTVIDNVWNQLALACDLRDNNTIAETFGTLSLGTYDTDWQMWRYDPMGGAYAPMDFNDELNIGESYWLFSLVSGGAPITGLMPDITEPWPVDTVGASGLGRPYMLSNPRNFFVDWNQLRFYYDGAEHDFGDAVSDGRVRSTMWTWNDATETYDEFNGLLDEGTLEHGDAFWIRVTDDAQVRFPITIDHEEDLPFLVPRQPGTPKDWMVTATLEGTTDVATVRFGHHFQASDGFDHFDAEKLSSPASNAMTMAFPQTDWGPYSADYVRDIRTPKSRDEWVMEIHASEQMQAVLHIDDPHGRLAASYLVDDATGQRIPISQLSRGGYSLGLRPGTRELRWVYIESNRH